MFPGRVGEVRQSLADLIVALGVEAISDSYGLEIPGRVPGRILRSFVPRISPMDTLRNILDCVLGMY